MIEDFNITIMRLYGLAEEEIHSDPDTPSENTLLRAYEFLLAADGLLLDFPRAAPSCFERDIHIYWIKDGRAVQLFVSRHNDRQPAVYWREGEVSHYERDATPDYLAERLKWFVEG